MVLLSLAAGGAATSGLVNMFAYNRDGWMTDVQVNQTRRYQRQQIRLSQAEMFREDIRDLVGASVTKQNNYVLIATLILGMIAECYVEGPMPEGASEFVTSAYMLCIGTSLLYLVLSVLCAVSATNLASKCQKDLLVTLVRLPVDEFVLEIDGAASRESVEAFEHQGMERMLRVPGLSRLRASPPPSADPGEQLGTARPSQTTSKQRSWPAASSAERPHADVRPEDVLVTTAPRRELSGGSDLEESRLEEGQQTPREQAEVGERHLAVFHEKEREWDVLGRFAFIFGAMGASHLLQAYGYFSAAKYYSGDDWASWIVQLLVVLVDAIFSRIYMNESPRGGLLGSVLNVCAPMACTLAIRVRDPVWVDAVCIPLCFSCHFLTNVWGFWQLIIIARRADEEALLERRPSSHDFSEAASSPRRRNKKSPRHACNEADGVPTKRPSASLQFRQRRYFLVFLGNAIVILAWLSTICWAVYHSVRGDGDDGVVIASPRSLGAAAFSFRRLAAVERQLHSGGLQPLGWADEHSEAPHPVGQPAQPLLVSTAAEVNVSFPSPRFRPHALACGGAGTCFAANEFLVFHFELGAATGPAASPVAEKWPCRVPGTIVDVAAACSDGRCRPLALVRDGSGTTSVVDCAKERSGEQRPSALSGPEARGFATRDGGTLFSIQGAQLVQHSAAAPPEGGWSPLWPVAQTGSDVASVDVVEGPGTLLLFRGGGAAEALDPDSGTACASWSWPVGPREAVSSGAVVEGSSVILLLRPRPGRSGFAASARLLRVGLPGLLDACGREAGPQRSGE